MSTADWRSDVLSRVRGLIQDVDDRVTEEAKWVKAGNPDGVPTWSLEGIICTGETYKAKVKLTFAQGASLPDPSGLFNSSLDAKVRRAIDISEGDVLDAAAFGDLVRDAIEFNVDKQAG